MNPPGGGPFLWPIYVPEWAYYHLGPDCQVAMPPLWLPTPQGGGARWLLVVVFLPFHLPETLEWFMTIPGHSRPCHILTRTYTSQIMCSRNFTTSVNRTPQERRTWLAISPFVYRYFAVFLKTFESPGVGGFFFLRWKGSTKGIILILWKGFFPPGETFFWQLVFFPTSMFPYFFCAALLRVFQARQRVFLNS